MRRLVNSEAVYGLDLSFKYPAVVRIPSGWKIGDWASLWTDSDRDALANSTTWVGRYSRISQIVRWMVDRVSNTVATAMYFKDAGHYVSEPRVMYVEDYAYGLNNSSSSLLSEVRGAVGLALHDRRGIQLRPVNISSARKLLLGKKPKQDAKVHVQRALHAVGATFETDDECDAFAVANYGLSEQGLTAMSLGYDAEACESESPPPSERRPREGKRRRR